MIPILLATTILGQTYTHLPKPSWLDKKPPLGEVARAVMGPIVTVEKPEIASLVTQDVSGELKTIGAIRRLPFRQQYLKDIYISKSGKWVYFTTRLVERIGVNVITVVDGKESRELAYRGWTARGLLSTDSLQ